MFLGGRVSYYEGAQEPMAIVVSDVRIDRVDPTMIPFKGKTLVEGHILDKTVAYKTVWIYIKDRWGTTWLLGQATTDADGNFSREFYLPKEIAEDGRYYIFAKYTDSLGDTLVSNEVEVCVCYDTEIEVSTEPDNVAPTGTEVAIGGQIRQVMPDGTTKGWGGAYVDIYIYDENWALVRQFLNVQADSMGYFNVRHTFDTPGLYHIVAVKEGYCSTTGVECHMGATASVDLEVVELALTVSVDKPILHLDDTLTVSVTANTQTMEAVMLKLVWYDEAGNEQSKTLEIFDITDYSKTFTLSARDDLASSILGRAGYLVATKGDIESNRASIVLLAPVRLSLAQTQLSVRPGGDVEVSGTIEYMSSYYAGAETWSPLADALVKGVWDEAAEKAGAIGSSARADSEGRFRFIVKAPEAGGSYTLNVVFEGSLPSEGAPAGALYLEPASVEVLVVAECPPGEECAPAGWPKWLKYVAIGAAVAGGIYLFTREK